MSWRNRYEYAAHLGRRVSKGKWMRDTRAYAVHVHKHKRVVYQEADGTLKGYHPSTMVLLPDTPRHSDRVTMAERFMGHGKRDRFAPRRAHDGIISSQRFD